MKDETRKSYFYPGQTVICIKSGAGWGDHDPQIGEAYTIRDIRVYSDGAYGIDIKENGHFKFFYDGGCFRPAINGEAIA